jgi:hypothetical protein
MLRLSVRKTRQGGFRVGYGKQFVFLHPSQKEKTLRASSRQEAHRLGKVEWRRVYGSITQRNIQQ